MIDTGRLAFGVRTCFPTDNMTGNPPPVVYLQADSASRNLPGFSSLLQGRRGRRTPIAFSAVRRPRPIICGEEDTIAASQA